MNKLEEYLKGVDGIELIPLPKDKDENWYKLRENTIGGSQIGSLFNENKYCHIRQLFAEKTGIVEIKRFSNPNTFLGTALEDSIIKLWEHYPSSKSIDELHENIANKNKVNEAYIYNGYIKNSNFPYIQGELDAASFCNKKLKVIEAKSQSGFAFKANNEQPNTSHLLQVQTYMALTGANKADLCVLVDGVDFRVFEVDRNDEVIAMIRERVISFYEDVLTYKETQDESLIPEVDESKACEDSLDSFFEGKKGQYREASDIETELMSTYKVLDADAKELSNKMRLIRNTLKDSLKENEYFIKDKLKCSWTKTKAGLRFQIRQMK